MSHNDDRLSPLATDELFDLATGRADTTLVAHADEVLAANPLQRDELARIRRTMERYREQNQRAAMPDPELTDALIQQACAESPRIPRRQWPMLALVASALLALAVAVLRLHGTGSEPVEGTRVRAVVRAIAPHAGQSPDYEWAEEMALRTARQESAGVSIGRSMRLTLRPDSRLRLRHSRHKRKTIVVERGSTVVAVSGRAPDERIRVATPSGTVEVTGTVFMVSVNQDTTRVAVSEGSTRFVAFDGRVTVVGTKQELVVSGRVMELRALRDASDREISKHSPDRSQGPVAQAKASNEPPAPSGTEPAALPGPADALSANANANTSPRPARPAQADGSDAESSARALYRRAEREMARGRLRRASALLGQLARRHRDDPVGAQALFEQATLFERRLEDKSEAARVYCSYLGRGPHATLRHEARQALSRLGWAQPDIATCD